MHNHSIDNRHIIVFDGVCNFCNGAINFIIKRDPQAIFVFTPMQCDFAQALIEKHGIDNVGFDTFLLVKNDQSYIWTDAAIEIAREFSGGWFLLTGLKVIPRPIRDFFYRLFARNRYFFFGRTEQCRVPTQEIRQRFIGID